MSSSSKSYNTVSIYWIEVNPPCLCHDQPVSKLREAWKPNNPAHSFYNCAKSMISNDNCNFFQWLEPSLPKHYKDTLWDMKLRIDYLLVRNGQVVELQKKVEKHKLLRKDEKELAEARIQELLIEIESLKKMLKKVALIAQVFLLFVLMYFKLF
ncbi:uncharacterized protein LOC111885283 [Lactuca sativa]|uniref:GRF-type domain-containing protein n=1 Tax=Lactuca sativa TaxID=4236 RepID=A0A9R1XWX1_LACSA|nr:uncharacterized protein LOC111885283 [Lactuca sativa]KAJ0223202.1 hypothetical protein LSAT_V11C200080990 [Lactuca sativa]